MEIQMLVNGDTVIVRENVRDSADLEIRVLAGKVGTITNDDRISSYWSDFSERERSGWYVSVNIDDHVYVMRLGHLMRYENNEGKNKYVIRFLTSSRKKMSDKIHTYYESTKEEALQKAESLIISGKYRNVVKLRVEEGE